jgi:chemotaxis protein CheX
MSGPNLINPVPVLPRAAWPATLREAAISTFSMMVGVSVSSPATDAPPVVKHITGVVGIAGALRAIFSLQCSAASSVKIASLMLGLSPDDPGTKEAACDAVGEICNIVAGDFKSRIGLGDACKLSLPTIIVGQDYRFHSGGKYERLEFPLVYDGETLCISLEIAQ